MIEMFLTGEVISAANVTPKVARLIGPAGTEIQTDVTITPPSINPFDITDISVKEGENIRFKLERKTASDRPEFILHISNTKTDPGRFFDKITLKTNSLVSPEISIRVFGIIRE